MGYSSIPTCAWRGVKCNLRARGLSKRPMYRSRLVLEINFSVKYFIEIFHAKLRNISRQSFIAKVKNFKVLLSF